MYRFMSVNIKFQKELALFITNINSKIGSREGRRLKNTNKYRRKYKCDKIFNTQKTSGQISKEQIFPIYTQR